MAQQLVRGGAPLDIPTTSEIGDTVDVRLHEFYRYQGEMEQARERERARAVKWMRLPVVTGTPASSALSIGKSPPVGPEQGYAWAINRLVVSGLTTGATPDVVNLYFNDTSTQPVWQFNGNNFGYVFDQPIVAGPGDVLMLASVGTFAATGRITLSGELYEIPAEMLAKLAI